MKIQSIQLGAVLLLLGLCHAPAATLYVDLNSTNPTPPYTDWSTAATDIQSAVDASTNGNQILVTNGIYQTGGRVVGTLTNRVVIDKAVTVQSVNGPAVTIIEGYQPLGGPVITNGIRGVYLASGAALNGFTVRKGAARDLFSNPLGGGIYSPVNSAYVSNCIIAENTAWKMGGGIYGATVVNSIITNNSCSIGGGAALSVIINSILSGNSAREMGGGAYSGTLINCTITQNIVQHAFRGGSGGGVNAALVFNSVIAGNQVAGVGGGAYGGALVNCTIVGNSATNGAGTAFCALTNCIIYCNTTMNAPTSITNWIFGSYDHCCTRPLPGGSGNFTNDPVLATISHLSLNSPCRGAGNGAVTSDTDIDGESWANPPSVGCDELYPGNATGNVNLSLWTAFTNFPPGYAGVFQLNNSGPITNSTLDFGDGTVVTNTFMVSHGWASAGDHPVVFTAYSDSFPAGEAASLTIHVATPTVFYVDADTLNPVPPYSDWSIAATNIQDAIDAASPGSIVLVKNGYMPYQSNGIAIYQNGVYSIYGASNRVAITKPIPVQSISGPQFTWIQGNHTGGDVRGVYMTNAATLSGFTVTNGWAGVSGNGGGICCESTNALITNCIICGCFGFYEGCGAYQGTFYNCTFFSNSPPSAPISQYGGGAYGSILNNCALYDNVSQNGSGAANSIANNCLFTNNGGIYYNGGGTYLCNVSNCVFFGNSSQYGGGALGGTLTNCLLARNSASYGGGAFGGIINSVGTYPITLNNCIIFSNVASQYGGGVSGSTPFNSNYCVLNNCTLSFNSATNEGGGAAFAALNSCSISNNLIARTIFSPGAACGGGVEGGLLNNCFLAGNYAPGGGGADSSSGAAGSCILNNCILSNNIAFNGPGGGAVNYVILNNCALIGNISTNNGLFGVGGGASSCTLSNCTLSGNISYSTSGGGGAGGCTLINCAVTSNLTSAFHGQNYQVKGGGTLNCSLINCILTYNAATNGGGDSGSTLFNCTVVSNSATSWGGVYNSTPRNSIIYFNGAGDLYSSSANYSPIYCCLPQFTNGVGNITNDPEFVNFAGGDFHLQSNSPCINSGNNAFVTVANDLDGNLRIQGGTVDIGAYEYQTPTSILSYAWAQQYGLPTDGSVDYLDLDGTGMKNWQKSIAGLNPTNPASVLAILPNVTNSAGGVTVSWQSVNTRTYYLQRATNLAAPSAFTAIQSNLTGQAVSTSYTDTSATNGGPYFYRVGVQ